MTKFLVTCTKIYNGTMFVDAENNEEALEIAQDKLNENVDCINWDFGEATADIADEEEVILDGDGVEESRIDPDYQPKYHVGEYIIWHHFDIKTSAVKTDIFQITDIKDGKYICSDGKEDVCDFLDYDKDFRLAEPAEISTYFEAHHKYNVGDTIGPLSRNGEYEKIIEIENGVYTFESLGAATIESIDNDKEISTKEKEYTFAKTDLMPFDKVLARDGKNGEWFASFFSHITNNDEYPYTICGGSRWEQCVPYNSETAYLLGTTTEYNGKYKTW